MIIIIILGISLLDTIRKQYKLDFIILVKLFGTDLLF